MVVGMEKGNMGIPRRTVVDAESESIVFRQTKVIRLSLIHEHEPTGGISVPGVRRYHVERGLQLCFKELFRFGFVRWRGHSHASYTRDVTSSPRFIWLSPSPQAPTKVRTTPLPGHHSSRSSQPRGQRWHLNCERMTANRELLLARSWMYSRLFVEVTQPSWVGESHGPGPTDAHITVIYICRLWCPSAALCVPQQHFSGKRVFRPTDRERQSLRPYNGLAKFPVPHSVFGINDLWSGVMPYFGAKQPYLGVVVQLFVQPKSRPFSQRFSRPINNRLCFVDMLLGA